MAIYVVLPFASLVLDTRCWRPFGKLVIPHPTGKPAVSWRARWLELIWRNQWVKGAIA